MCKVLSLVFGILSFIVFEKDPKSRCSKRFDWQLAHRGVQGLLSHRAKSPPPKKKSTKQILPKIYLKMKSKKKILKRLLKIKEAEQSL